MTTIDILHLKKITNQILDHLIQERGITSITLENDLYWTVPSESMYCPEKPPTELDVGSLYDDWEILKAGSADPADTVVLQLAELAPILRYIGEKTISAA